MDTNYRSLLENSLGINLSDGVWRRIESLPSLEKFQNGLAPFNEWVDDCVAFLVDVGVLDAAPTAIGLPIEESWDGEKEASRQQVDLVKAHLIAQHARDNFAELIKGWREVFDSSKPETLFKSLNYIAYIELKKIAVESNSSELGQFVQKLAEQKFDWMVTADQQPDLRAVQKGYIVFWLPDSERAYFIPYFDEDGMLAQIKKIVDLIAYCYRWNFADAFSFLVFDRVPACPSWTAQWAPHFRLSGLSRIELSLDPTLSPDEVREIFNIERRKYLKYPMRISNKHLWAAYSAFGRDTERPWKIRFEDHKKGVAEDEPSLQFANAKTFRRDAEKAMKKLLLPSFVPDTATD